MDEPAAVRKATWTIESLFGLLACMETIQAILFVSGETASVLELVDGRLPGTFSGTSSVSLAGRVLSRVCVGDPVHDEIAIVNSVILELPISAESDEAAIDDVENWLRSHFDALAACDARKVLEFHLFLDSNMGSRTLQVPNSIVRLCADSGMDVATQAIRLLTKSERAALRPDPE